MNRFLPKPSQCRRYGSRLGSLLMLFQRTPVMQWIFPQANIVGGAGVCELGTWSIATVVGLGAFDSVAGATTIVQIAPNQGASTVNATKGKNLNFVFQLTNYSDTPGSWKVTGLPAGLTHADVKNNTIDSVSGVPTQSGSFSVKITAYAGSSYGGDSFSKTFTMNVAEDPTITIGNPPASKTINSGQTTVLTVDATGGKPLIYKWYRGPSGTKTDPVGTNSPSFTTPALTATTKYWVNVSNALNPAGENSATATVTVIQPAAIAAHPSSVTIDSGDTATLNVAATGTAPITYQWYQGTSGNTGTPVGSNSPSFVTPALTTTTAYWVKVSNAANLAGSASQTATVTVTQPLSVAIQTHPAPTTVHRGGSATLSVNASGTGTLAYQWYQGPSGNTSTPVGTDSPSFTTPPLAAPSTYWVRVTNGIDTLDSRAATVSPLPMIGLEQPTGNPLKDGVSAIAFGNVGTGRGLLRTFTITNTAETETLTDLAVSLTGAQAGQFLLTPPAVTLLAPSESTTFTVEFRPPGTGPASAALHVTTSVAGETPFDVALSGNGFLPFPDIQIQQPTGTNLVDGKSTKSLGTTAVGKRGRTLTFVVKNSGGINLTGLAVNKTGPHARDFIVTAPPKTTVPPGASTSFKITFKPTAKGTRKAAIHLKSNDPDENPFDVKLSGISLP
jgi:hypothetical protein